MIVYRVCVFVCVCLREMKRQSLAMSAHYSFLCRGEIAVFSSYVIKKLYFDNKADFLLEVFLPHV